MSLAKQSKSEHAGLIMQIQYCASRLNDIKNGIRRTTVKLNQKSLESGKQELPIRSFLLQMNMDT